MTWSWSCSVCGRAGEVADKVVVFFHKCSEPFAEDRRVRTYRDLPPDRETRPQWLWRNADDE